MTEYAFYELSESIQTDIITYMDNFKGSTYFVDDRMIDNLCQIVVDKVKEAKENEV
tara:strand:+ start:585 stop:752 length:168 start_codon:yes stop_codon:yes gene_type:complete